MSSLSSKATRPVESFRTEAYQLGWRAFEERVSRDDTPYRDAKPFSAWYDWRAGFDDRAYLEGSS